MCQAGEFPLDEKLTSPIASEPQVLAIFLFPGEASGGRTVAPIYCAEVKQA